MSDSNSSSAPIPDGLSALDGATLSDLLDELGGRTTSYMLVCTAGTRPHVFTHGSLTELLGLGEFASRYMDLFASEIASKALGSDLGSDEPVESSDDEDGDDD